MEMLFCAVASAQRWSFTPWAPCLRCLWHRGWSGRGCPGWPWSGGVLRAVRARSSSNTHSKSRRTTAWVPHTSKHPYLYETIHKFMLGAQVLFHYHKNSPHRFEHGGSHTIHHSKTWKRNLVLWNLQLWYLIELCADSYSNPTRRERGE